MISEEIAPSSISIRRCKLMRDSKAEGDSQRRLLEFGPVRGPVPQDEKNMRRAEGFLRQIEVRMPAICVKNAA
jgi:hypothetical protein